MFKEKMSIQEYMDEVVLRFALCELDDLKIKWRKRQGERLESRWRQ